MKKLIILLWIFVMYTIEKARQMIAFELTTLHMTRQEMFLLDAISKLEIVLFVVVSILIIKYILGGIKNGK